MDSETAGNLVTLLKSEPFIWEHMPVSNSCLSVVDWSVIYEIKKPSDTVGMNNLMSSLWVSHPSLHLLYLLIRVNRPISKIPMHPSHIPQYIIQNRNVHISVLNNAFWDKGQVHCGICEIGLL